MKVRLWTDPENAVLRRMCAARAPWETIAAAVKRSVRACQEQATRLVCANPKDHEWPPAETAMLAALLQAGTGPAECARQLTARFGHPITTRRVINKAWRMPDYHRKRRIPTSPAPTEADARERPFRDNLDRAEARWDALLGALIFESVADGPEAPYREAFGEEARAL